MTAAGRGRRRRPGTRRTSLTWVLRALGAGLLAAMAAIHLRLYLIGYSEIPVIGALFLLNAALGFAGALALLGLPRRWLPPACAGCALLAAGTIGGLLLSHYHGLFGFAETLRAPYATATLVIEAAAAITTAALGVTVFDAPARRR